MYIDLSLAIPHGKGFLLTDFKRGVEYSINHRFFYAKKITHAKIPCSCWIYFIRRADKGNHQKVPGTLSCDGALQRTLDTDGEPCTKDYSYGYTEKSQHSSHC